MAAACGVVVPKMSGRGLGHTGGTLDKLESIPGFRVDLTIEEFKSVLRDVGTSIIGQTATARPRGQKDLCAARRDGDGRKHSADSSSIMSKKLAEGSNAAAARREMRRRRVHEDRRRARALARVNGRRSAGSAGFRTEAFVTDMDAPLGSAIGNALEIIECFDMLKGAGPAELNAVATRLASRMVVLAGLEHDAPAAAARVESALTSGRALQTLSRMIELQGGNPRVVTDYRLMPSAPDRAVVSAWRSGFVTRMAALAIGRAAHVLGAGRSKVGEPVDHGVGAITLAHVGDQVRDGQPLIELHHRGGRGLDDALALSREAIVIDDHPLPRARRSWTKCDEGAQWTLRANWTLRHRPMDAETIEPRLGQQPWTRHDGLILGSLVVIAAIAIGLGFAGVSRVQPIAGLALILALAYCASSARRAIDYRTVAWGLTLQFVFALIVLKTTAGQDVVCRRRPPDHEAAEFHLRRVVVRVRPAG